MNNGIIYRGPSLIDGAPIVCVAIYHTTDANAKTGVMLQTYILRADVSPMDAIRQGLDVSICGDCKHRGNGQTYGSRSCYVNIGQGPRAVFDAFQRGRYPVLDTAATAAIGAGRMVRLGTYGDPAAVPVYVWQALLSAAAGHTGYTHQWRQSFAADLRAYVMASADSLAERVEALAAGWRTFRVLVKGEALAAREFACPASAEAGKKVTCSQCLACNGATGRKGSPAIVAHGSLAIRFESNRIGATT